MQTAPAGYETEWEEAVRDLKPFATLVYVSKGEGARSDTYDLADFIALSCVKSLYANLGFGNAASSQLDGQSHVYKAEIGDRLRVSLRPASSSAGAQVWYGHFIVNSTDLDPYTGICSFTAVDALTYYESVYYENTADEDEQLTFKEIVETCASKISVPVDYNYLPRASNSFTWGYYLEGFTCREILQRIACTCGMNVTINNTGKLAFRESAGSLDITPFLLNVGRRAERITHNGTWGGVRYDVKAHVLQFTPSKQPILPSPASFSGELGNPVYAMFSGEWVDAVGVNSGFVGADIYKATSFLPFNLGTKGAAYSAFAAENVVITPLVELGDPVIALGKASTSLITDEFMQPLLYDDGTRLNAENPREYTPYWDAQVSTQEIYGIVGKITVDFRTPQIATIESLPPVS